MILPLEKQVTCLELSKQLEEAGYQQDGLWWWVTRKGGGSRLKQGKQTNLITAGMMVTTDIRNYVAPTVAELGEALPKIVESVIEIPIQFEIMIIRPTDCRAPQWDILYISPLKGKDVLAEEGADTLANAMAKMWLYLKKKKLI